MNVKIHFVDDSNAEYELDPMYVPVFDNGFIKLNTRLCGTVYINPNHVRSFSYS